MKGSTFLLEGFLCLDLEIVQSVRVCMYFVCRRRLTRLEAWVGCVCVRIENTNADFDTLLSEGI